jgi:glycine oxidase
MIAIIGGGIIGLSIGWYLARAGQSVTVFERGQIEQGATWAAGGILSPWGMPGSTGKTLLKLQLASHALWPEFEKELTRAANVPSLGYRTEGRLLVSLDHEGAAGLRERFDFNISWGVEADWISGDEARRIEPHLPPTVTNAVFTTAGHQVDNRLVLEALRTAFLRAGGVLRDQTAVRRIVVDRDIVTGVDVGQQIIPAETVVLAAGAWSGQIAGLVPTLQTLVHPVKGQMLAVGMSSQMPLLTHIITGLVYLIPRLDGRLVIGATVEETGFSADVTAGGVYRLLADAHDLLPAIETLPIVETWAGLRPATPDGLPLLGRTGVDGLIMATGHYRHGILLAPITAQTISQIILTGSDLELMKPFSPERF